MSWSSTTQLTVHWRKTTSQGLGDLRVREVPLALQVPEHHRLFGAALPPHPLHPIRTGRMHLAGEGSKISLANIHHLLTGSDCSFHAATGLGYGA